jgi:hypothetical protein
VKRGEVRTLGAALAPSLLDAPTYRSTQLAEETREAFEERAAIIEFDGKRPRAVAERWARACVERVPGAVRFVHLLAASGAVRRAP